MFDLFILSLRVFSTRLLWVRITLLYEWVNEWVNEWMIEWMSEWMSEWVNEWMIDWMSEWVNDWLNELTVGFYNSESFSPFLVYQSLYNGNNPDMPRSQPPSHHTTLKK